MVVVAQKTQKLQGFFFFIFRKIGFLNFAILKSSPNSETGPLIKKWFQ